MTTENETQPVTEWVKPMVTDFMTKAFDSAIDQAIITLEIYWLESEKISLAEMTNRLRELKKIAKSSPERVSEP